MIKPTPAKCFKEAVASPARSSVCCKSEKRLADVELLLKSYKHRFRELNRKVATSCCFAQHDAFVACVNVMAVLTS